MMIITPGARLPADVVFRRPAHGVAAAALGLGHRKRDRRRRARRLICGALAGALSRTFVAPLETIRTHLMVGSCGADTMGGVFRWIMQTEGWPGLFRGNAVNVLRVAPSKAIEASQLMFP
jgi:hypothetical protein